MLWIALVVFLAVLLAAGLLLANPATVAAGAYLGAWAFLAYTCLCEGVDWAQQRLDRPTAPFVSAAPDPWWNTSTMGAGDDEQHALAA